MKLESFREKKNKNIGMIAGIVSVVLLLAAIFVYRTYSIYQERQEFDVIKGTVPDQNYDIMFIFYLIDENGNKTVTSTIPEGRDYEVTVECTNGANGTWDTEAWGPRVTNLTTTRTKCYINIGPYQEEILHGTGPVLKEGLIPVTISDDGVVHKANISEEWYRYANQKWANAVILEDESKTYANYEEIPEDNIESYFVWIPRYKYQLFDLGEYTKVTSNDKNAIKTINVVFGTDTTDDANEGECTTPMLSGESGNCKVDDYMTHPSFLAFDVKGIWVGKFETGYKGATSKSGAQKNENNPDKIEIKPNVYSWRNINAANAYLNAYNYKREYDSHMMKSTEWGAVAYLQHSAYGSQASVRINNNSNYITGYAAKKEPTTGPTGSNIAANIQEGTSLGKNGTNTFMYNTSTGYLASTTANITGVYDMCGGSWDRMMSVMVDSKGSLLASSSGFGSNVPFPEDEKYYDKYKYGTSDTSINRRILGDATGEMGPFGYANYGYNDKILGSWYKDELWMVNSSNPWPIRGAGYDYGTSAGMFHSSRGTGAAGTSTTFRIVLAPNVK